MSRYYECDNILNDCCDKYKKKCHRKKRKKHKYHKDLYPYNMYDSYNYEHPYGLYSNMYPYPNNSGSYDNILILLIIIFFLCNNDCNTCCDNQY